MNEKIHGFSVDQLDEVALCDVLHKVSLNRVELVRIRFEKLGKTIEEGNKHRSAHAHRNLNDALEAYMTSVNAYLSAARSLYFSKLDDE